MENEDNKFLEQTETREKSPLFVQEQFANFLRTPERHNDIEQHRVIIWPNRLFIALKALDESYVFREYYHFNPAHRSDGDAFVTAARMEFDKAPGAYAPTRLTIIDAGTTVELAWAGVPVGGGRPDVWLGTSAAGRSLTCAWQAGQLRVLRLSRTLPTGGERGIAVEVADPAPGGILRALEESGGRVPEQLFWSAPQQEPAAHDALARDPLSHILRHDAAQQRLVLAAQRSETVLDRVSVPLHLSGQTVVERLLSDALRRAPFEAPPRPEVDSWRDKNITRSGADVSWQYA